MDSSSVSLSSLGASVSGQNANRAKCKKSLVQCRVCCGSSWVHNAQDGVNVDPAPFPASSDAAATSASSHVLALPKDGSLFKMLCLHEWEANPKRDTPSSAFPRRDGALCNDLFSGQFANALPQANDPGPANASTKTAAITNLDALSVSSARRPAQHKLK
ncbi:hypothetical protein HDU77_008984 [Chytriomyces hyalinus]|nr:hypothetical protein HDU77_008984 [Chytriomyces hyalinus]